MIKSIMQDKKECYYTHSPYGLHLHHIMNGAFRKKSEKYGLVVYLRHDFHVGTNYAIHNNPKKMLELKAEAQRRFEEIYSHELWMKEFHKNYL